MRKTSTSNMSHDDWLENRRSGLGGSDAGSILGINPYSTPLDTYLDKVGEGIEIADNDAMYWGRALEDLVADEYATRTGQKVQRRNAILQHPKHPWMLANLDRWIVGQNAILECKTAGGHLADQWGETGTDRVPDHYLAQVTHYLAVTGAKYADIAVLIGGRDFRIFHIPRDEDLIKQIIRAEEIFWKKYVLTRTPPAPRDLADIAQRWPIDSGQEMIADEELRLQIATMARLKEGAKQLAGEVKVIEAEVKKSMRESAVLVDELGVELVTWRTAKPSTKLDTKRLKAEQPELAREFSIEVPGSRRFLIK